MPKFKKTSSKTFKNYNFVSICLHCLSWIDWTSDLVIADFLKDLRGKSIYFPNTLAQSTSVINSFPVEYCGVNYDKCVNNLVTDNSHPPSVNISDKGRFMVLPDTIFDCLNAADYDWRVSMEGYFKTLMPKIFENESLLRFNEILKRQLPFEMALQYLEKKRDHNKSFALMFQINDTHRPWGMKNHPYFPLRAKEVFNLESVPDDIMGARWAAMNEPDNLSFIRRLGLARACQKVKLIFESLERSGVLNKTIVLIYSNHGEVFDHFRHSQNLKYSCVSHGDVMMFDALEHVFQMWIVPNLSPMVLPHRIRIIDIVPTVISLLELPELIKRDGETIHKLFYKPDSEEHNSRDSLCLSPKAYSFRNNCFKLYHCNNEESYFKDALFDMSWDRSERHNLINLPGYNDVLATLSTKLRDILSNR